VQTAFGIGALKEKKETDLETCLPRKLTLATPFSKPRSCLANSSYNPDFAPARPLAGGDLMAGAIRPTKQPPRLTPIAFPQTLAVAKAAAEATPTINRTQNQNSKIYNQKSKYPRNLFYLCTYKKHLQQKTAPIVQLPLLW
jgi:hypothetical protein